MKLKSLKDLERAIDICRAKGVREITIDGVHMKIDEPLKPNVQSEVQQDPEYTDDQLATWSSDGQGL